MTLENILALVASAKASGPSLDGAVVAVAKPRVLPLQKMLAEAEAQVKIGGYVDVFTLAPGHIGKLRDQSALGGTEKRVELTAGSGVYLTGAEAPMEDFSKMCDATKFLQGMNYLFVVLYARSTMAGRLLDMLTWHNQLWASPLGTQGQKVRYARAFMYKYQLDKADNWTEKFQSDYQLFQEHLQPVVAGSADGHKRERPARMTAAEEPSKRGERKRPDKEGGGGRKRSAPTSDSSSGGRKRTAPHEMLCNSRRAPVYKECTYAGCRYVHTCATCQGNHAAVACTQWNDTKAAAWIAQKGYS